MKFTIIGLGNFGFALAEKLAQLGHEVIGVDKNIEKVEEIKDKITHAICLDCSLSLIHIFTFIIGQAYSTPTLFMPLRKPEIFSIRRWLPGSVRCLKNAVPTMEWLFIKISEAKSRPSNLT